MSLFERASDLAVRVLSQDQFMTLRSLYFGTRRRLNPLMRAVYGTFDAHDLRSHLEERVGTDFEILMVHGSINNMQPMYKGNAVDLVRMLIDFCGPQRTLAMPAFFFGDPHIGSVVQTFTANPRFNLKSTPSQMGLFTEVFRRTKGVIQSRHPVYRIAAMGPMAERLVEGHENATGPAGLNSPFEYMATHDTLILGIGKSYHVMTQVHHADELLGEDLPAPRTPLDERTQLPVVVVDGDKEIPVTLIGSGIRWRFDIHRLPKLLRPGDMDCWTFHHVPMFAARAKAVTESLVAAGRQGHCIYSKI